MAVSQDASTPAVIRSASSSTSATVTTASFTPPIGSLLVAMYGIEYKGKFSQTTYTTTWTSTGSSSWRLDGAGYWDPPYPKQGQYSSFGNNVGIYVFNSANMRSVLSGAVITKCEVYLSRRSEGGVNGPNNAYTWTHQIDAVDGAAPSFTNVQGVQTIGGFSWGTSKWTTVSNTMGTNFQSGLAHSFALWDADGDSSDYSIWADTMQIRITYTVTGATPTIAISDSAGGSWGSARNTQVNTTTNRAILTCWTRAPGGTPPAMTVTCTRSVDTSAASMSLAVFVVTGQAASQTGALIAHSIGTSTTSAEATMNLQKGSLVYPRLIIDNATAAMTKTANITQTDAWVNATDLAQLFVGRLTTATAAAGNVTLGWTTSDTASRKTFQALEILSGSTAITLSQLGAGRDSMSVKHAFPLNEHGGGVESMTIVTALSEHGAGTDVMLAARAIYEVGQGVEWLNVLRVPVYLMEVAGCYDELTTAGPPAVTHGYGGTSAYVTGELVTTGRSTGATTAPVQDDNGQTQTSRPDVSGQTTAVVL